jgi:hypothetical protein
MVMDESERGGLTWSLDGVVVVEPIFPGDRGKIMFARTVFESRILVRAGTTVMV